MDVRKTEKKSKTDNVNPMTTCNLVRLTIIIFETQEFQLKCSPTQRHENIISEK